MSRELLTDDDLLPLSGFSGNAFNAVDLAKKRLLISQGDMSKLISDYERATSIELVSLVNENYGAFLKVSNDIGSISDRLGALKDHLPHKYMAAIKEVSELVRKTHALKSEAELLQDTREDVVLLDGLIGICRGIEMGLSQKEVGVEELSILAREYERVHALTEATEAVLAEGKRRGSPLLRESISTVIREEQKKLKTELVSRLLSEAEKCVESFAQLLLVYDSLCRLNGKSKFITFLKRFFFLHNSKAQVVSEYISEVRRRYMELDSKFFKIASFFCPKLDLWIEVFLPVVIETLSSRSHLSIFVPTGSNLDEFEETYNLLKFFFCDFSQIPSSSNSGDQLVTSFMGKFKVSIYFNLRVKALLETERAESIGDTIEKLFSGKILIDRKMLFGKSVQVMLDILARSRTAAEQDATTGSLGKITLLKEIYERKIIEVEIFLKEKICVGEKVMRLVEIQKQLALLQINKLVEAIVEETTRGPVQTLESVKQMSALYRVVSRGFPTRPSAYVDLVLKPISAFLESLGGDGEWFTDNIGAKVVGRIYGSFTLQAKQLIKREEEKKSTILEKDKIICQLYLDGSRILDTLFKYVNVEEGEELANLVQDMKKVYVEHFPE